MTEPTEPSEPTETPDRAAPWARRLTTRQWRDPRLLAGIVVIALSVVLGARLLASADDTVPVWVATGDLPAGTTLSEEHLEQQRVRFASGELAQRYLSAAGAAPVGAVLRRPVGRGELLPRAGLGTAGRSDLLEVPLAVPAEFLPATVRAGTRVDVWVTRGRPAGVGDPAGEEDARLVFDDALVVAVPSVGGALGPSTTRQVIIGLAPERQAELGPALASLAAGTVVLTRQG